MTPALVVRAVLGLMLVELSVVEQWYRAVMEVLAAGVPVVEVAERYGVSSQGRASTAKPSRPERPGEDARGRGGGSCCQSDSGWIHQMSSSTGNL